MEHYFTNNMELKSDIRTLKYDYGNVSFSFFSDNGVFAKNKIDYGSIFLIDCLIKNRKSNVGSLLDVGCGYGFLGIVLGKLLNISVDLVDVNKRALHLAKRNAECNKVKAEVYESDCYNNVYKKYDLIISNPPIRAGKEVVLKILEGAKDHLLDGGELWFVMRKDQGAKSVIKVLEKGFFVEIIDKSKGFFVVKAKNC